MKKNEITAIAPKIDESITPKAVRDAMEIAQQLAELPPEVRAIVQNMTIGAITCAEMMAAATQKQKDGGAA